MSLRGPMPPRHLIAILGLAACGGTEPMRTLPAGSVEFGVFGDAPYNAAETGRYRAVLGEVNAARPAWLFHVGDLLGGRCADDVIRARHTELLALETAVVYTPGDNEWTDCHRDAAGNFDPLERLAFIRRLFFPTPTRTLGRRPLTVTSQAGDSAWADIPEQVRWRIGKVLVVTLHLVGSDNGTEGSRRRPADDSAQVRRTAAAVSWLDSAFAVAARTGMRGVVIAMHGNPGFDQRDGVRKGYQPFMRALRRHAESWPGEIVVVHGDSHELRTDHPMADSTGRPMQHFTRVETYGSPQVGWLRVALDTLTGRIAVEPRLMSSLRFR